MASQTRKRLAAAWGKVSSQYTGVGEIFARYWECYGGFGALITSPYFHVAIGLTILLPAYWQEKEWYGLSTSVLPNIIGFALGGYAIWLGFGDEKFRGLISQKREGIRHTPYMEVSATFAHFIVVQLIALICGLVATGLSRPPSDVWIGRALVWAGVPSDFITKYIAQVGNAIGFFFLAYALLAALAATLAVFRVASWFDAYRNSIPRREQASRFRNKGQPRNRR